MKANIVEAVLNAADEWVSAQEALVAAKQIFDETEARGKPSISQVLGWPWR